ncbi:DUF5683 domain-containing protein [Bacteroidota bacterium]
MILRGLLTTLKIWIYAAILILLMAFFCYPVLAQDEAGFEMVEADTIMIDSFLVDHSPKKAAMYSAVLPGMGQAYNRKYWKLPIVYGGLGGLAYGAIWNSRQYTYFFDLYKYMTENGYDEYEGRTLREVTWYKDSHLRYKNLLIILTVGFYAIQIVDAAVDAHLIDYDISDDITLKVDPVMLDPSVYPTAMAPNGRNTATFGLRCCLSF